MQTTLTLENLQCIYDAMSKIKEIDRSNYFNQYFKEEKTRVEEEKVLVNINKLLGEYSKINENDRITEYDND
jgi:hypothetical protein